MNVNLQFLFVNFVQDQEITMPENVGFITVLIANYCARVSATLFVVNWCESVRGSLLNMQ